MTPVFRGHDYYYKPLHTFVINLGEMYPGSEAPF